MKKLTTRIMSGILAFLLIVSGCYSAIGMSYAQENASDSVVNSYDSRSNNSTSKIELKIGQLKDDGLVKMSDGWYTQQVVDSAVDLDISGNSFSVENPYLVIKIPKTKKIKDVKTIDSQAAKKTERYEDENYQYVKYYYNRLTGGNHSTYPFYFTFDGHFATNGDIIEVEAMLYGGDDSVLATVKQKYTAKTLGYEISSDYNRSGIYTKKRTERLENGNIVGHDNVILGMIEKEGDLKTSPYLNKNNLQIVAMLYPKKIEGQTGNLGLEYPKNIKTVITYPKDEAKFRYIGEDKETSIQIVKVKDNVVEVINKNPDFKSDLNSFHFEPPVPLGLSVWFDSNLKDISVNKKLPVSIEFYKNVNEDGTGGEFIGKLTDSFEVEPYAFKQDGNFSAISEAFEDYYIAKEFHYIYNPRYYHMNGNVFKGTFNVQEQGGVPFVAYIGQSNNGAGGHSPYKGGITETINEIYIRLKNEGSYINNVQLWFSSGKPESPEADNVGNAIKNAINDGNTRLYGINEDGTEDLLEEHIKIITDRKNKSSSPLQNDDIAWYSEYIDIGNRAKKYKEVVVRFEKPILMDNTIFRLRNRVWFTDDMLNKFKNLKDEVLSFETEVAVSKLDKKENKFIKSNYIKYPTNYFTVESLHPSVNEFISDPQTVHYTEDGTFDYLVGGTEINQRYLDHARPDGNLKEIKNVKTITLLPSGYEYSGKYEKALDLDNEWKSKPVNEPKITTVDNFNGTGKKAIVVEYGNLPVAGRYPINLKLRATKNAPRGESDFVNYMTYDDNDFIRPENSKTGKEYDYVDDLDLDGDGDRTEIFMQKHTKVTFVPPLELLLNNTVQSNSSYNLSTTADLGQEISYKVNIFNNSIKDITKLDIIDVLPDLEDHSISPNDKGEYIKRNSEFPVTLTKSLEEVNSADVNSKVEFRYQVTKQGSDLNSVLDGEWLTKDQITDFSNVKSVKITLKTGQMLKSKEEIDIIIPSKIPYDTKLKDDALAYNSSAFSTDGRNYNEGNITSVGFAKYLVKGIAFYDTNKNGQFDEGDILAKGVNINLLTKDGNKATDLNGKELKTTTDEKGEYTISVYSRGDYKVSFVKDNAQEYNKASSGDESVSNSIDVATINGNEATTAEFTLLPVHKEQIKNVALIKKFGQINIVKLSDELDENGKAKPLSGGEFVLLTKDDKEVVNSDGTKVEKVVTDKDGKASFIKIPHGEYKVKEIKAPENHIIVKETYDVSLTDLNNSDVTIEIQNKKNPKISVSGEKIWNDENNQDGIRPNEVTIHLFVNGVDSGKTAKATKDSNWKYTFENLDTYDSNGKVIDYTVKEDVPEGYTSKVEGTKITNTHSPELINIPVEKKWVDDNNSKNYRPNEVTIHLFANEDEVGEYKLLSNEDWKHTFENLPKFKEGKEIKYSIKEDKVENYSTSYSGDYNTKFTVTNTIEGKVSIPVTKKWIGKESDKATIHLLGDDKEVSKVTLTKDTNWQHVFENLDRFKEGKEIVYTIKEDSIDGYESKISGDMTNYLVTNTNMATKDISLVKTWKVKEGKEIEVTLLRDDKEIQNIKISKQDDWKYTFKDLEVYDKADGHKYNYKISEKSLAGYLTEIKGNEDEGFELINTYSPIPVIVDPPVKKVVKGNPKVSEVFTFQMKELDKDNPMPEGSKDGIKTIMIIGSGEVEFGKIEIKLPGTYSYEIMEINDGIKGYEYDSSIYKIVFEVKDINGKLIAESKIVKENNVEKEIIFTNTYIEPSIPNDQEKPNKPNISDVEGKVMPKTGYGTSIGKYGLMIGLSIVFLRVISIKKRKNI